jgi:hypothetical protein
MKLEIVKEIPKEGKPIINLDVNIHLATLLEIDEHIASALIRDTYGIKYFQSLDDDNWGSEMDDITEIPLNGSVYLDYPLSVIVKLDIVNVDTIGSLLWQVAKAYEQIYQEEESSTKDPILYGKDRGLVLNRNKTNGIYGIGYHDIEDLYIEIVTIYDNGCIEIGMGS